MWYDPRFKCVRRCQHRCRISHGRFAHCGPSLLEDSGRARSFAELTRRNPSLVKARGTDFTELVLPKRRKAKKRTDHKASNQDPETPKAIDVPCHHHPIPIVAKPYPKPERTRNPRSVTSISRIRKCLGSRSFGKLNKRGTKKVPIAPTGLEIPLQQARVRKPRSRDGGAADQKPKKPRKANSKTATADLLD